MFRKFKQLFNRKHPSSSFDFRRYSDTRHHKKIKIKNIDSNVAKMLDEKRNLDDQSWMLWAIEQELIVSKDEKKLDVDINNFDRFVKKTAVAGIRKSMYVRADQQIQAGKKLKGAVAKASAASKTMIPKFIEIEEQAPADQDERMLEEHQDERMLEEHQKVLQTQMQHKAERDNAILEVPTLLQNVLKSHRITATIIIVLAVIAILVPFFEITFTDVKNWFRILTVLINFIT